GAHLLDIFERLLQAKRTLAACPLQVAPAHVLKHEVMKDRSLQVACRAVPQPAQDVRVADAVKSDRLILKIFYECAFKVGVDVVLKKNIKSLYDHAAVDRMRSRERVARRKYLGIAAAP